MIRKVEGIRGTLIGGTFADRSLLVFRYGLCEIFGWRVYFERNI